MVECQENNMGISRDSWHKRRKTGGKRVPIHKKRKFELGRPAANTKIGARRVHLVRCRGGNIKYRGLRLDTGNFAWASEGCTSKTRIIDTIYNATSNELVRTKTLVKGAIIAVDAVPFRQWYEGHYAQPLGRKKGGKLNEEEEARLDKSKLGKKTQKKYEERSKLAPVEPHLVEQFQAGRLLARIASRPGQSGRADGYILEGKELEFYLRKIRVKKAK
uniref:40S ribosomal protein S8 n=1 Tax=Panagrolaimus sp. ES5 TaxID=591445 RepID=A0AC34F6E7_9BILA